MDRHVLVVAVHFLLSPVLDPNPLLPHARILPSKALSSIPDESNDLALFPRAPPPPPSAATPRPRRRRDRIQDAAMRLNPRRTDEIQPQKEQRDQSQERRREKKMEGGKEMKWEKVLRSDPKHQPLFLSPSKK